MKRIRNIAVFAPLPFFVFAFLISGAFPDFTADFYSQRLYPAITRGMGAFFGHLPFCAGEWLIYTFIVFLAARILTAFLRSRGMKALAKKGIRGLFLYAGIVYGLFVLLWGFNYNRPSFAETAGFSAGDVSCAELAACAEILARRINVWAESLAEDKGERERAFADEERIKTFFGAKPFFMSKLLSRAGLGGFYCPFTGEAVYNRDMPASSVPFTAAHEFAHRLGFARENEANLIAYMLCSFTDSGEYRYSADLAAFSYVIGCLAGREPALAKEKTSLLCGAALEDIKERRRFWQERQGVLGDISEKVNDVFLKANGQKDGIGSYGKFAELLAALYRKGFWEERIIRQEVAAQAYEGRN